MPFIFASIALVNFTWTSSWSLEASTYRSNTLTSWHSYSGLNIRNRGILVQIYISSSVRPYVQQWWFMPGANESMNHLWSCHLIIFTNCEFFIFTAYLTIWKGNLNYTSISKLVPPFFPDLTNDLLDWANKKLVYKKEKRKAKRYFIENTIEEWVYNRCFFPRSTPELEFQGNS